MKVVFCVLHLSALVCLASAGDAIKDRSPDGKFALHLTDDSAATVEADSRKLVLDLYLDVAGPGWIERAKCLWSPDSKRFAFYSPDRRGGSATIYQRKDSAFEKVELPDVPSCEVGRVFEASEKPKRWLKSNALALIAALRMD